MKYIFPIRLIMIFGLLFLIVSPLFLVYPQGEVGLNWKSSSYDDDNTGFNPQNVITKENVDQLQLQWIHRLPRNPYEGEFVSSEDLGIIDDHGNEMVLVGLEKSEGVQANPLVINGIVYVLTSFGSLTAISSSTGYTVWTFEVNVTAALEKPWIVNRGIQRSITYYQGNIYFQSLDCSIYGLEATTGKVNVEILDTCKDVPGNIGSYYGEEAPIFFGNIMLVSGASGFGQGRGYMAAYDLLTGDLLWRWYSSPPMIYGSTLDVDWEKGNISPYENDWVGEVDTVVGAGAAIRSIGVIDEEKGVVFIGTGPPLARSLASHGHPAVNDIPGPNLYSNSIVALDIGTGDVIWYYQIDPHDIHRQGIYGSLIMTEIDVNGINRKAIIAPSFQGFVYVLDADTGELIYDPIKVGAHLNDHNVNMGNNADMTANQDDAPKNSQGSYVYCPGPEGGIAAPMAYAYNKIFVAIQNDCFEMRKVVREGEEFWSYSSYGMSKQNSTVYAIDASNGNIIWDHEIPRLYWFAGLTVSGGVVYALDQPGTLYMIDADTGNLISSIPLDFSGDAGVSIGSAANGKMTLFVVTGTSELVYPTEGMVLAFALPDNISGGDSNMVIVYAAIAVAIISILFAVFIIIRKR